MSILRFRAGLLSAPLWACPLACSSAGPAPAPPQRTLPLAVTATASATTTTSSVDEPPVPIAPKAPTIPPPGLEALRLWNPPARDLDEKACEIVKAAQRAASARNAKVPKNAIRITVDPPPCVPAKNGVFGLVMTISGYTRNDLDLQRDLMCEDPSNPCVYDAELSIVPMFVTSKGAVTKGKKLSATSFFDHGPTAGSAAAYDFDGDGADELIFGFQQESMILQVKGNALAPYPGAMKFRAIRDIDGDSRPDLVLPNPYELTAEAVGCGHRGGHPVFDFAVDLPVVARSLPGGAFSTTDPLAVNVTKTACPFAPTPIVVKDKEGHFDNSQIRTNVVCARAWGVPEADVLQALQRDCVWPPPEDECDALFDVRDGKPIGTCAGESHLIAWAKSTPPITVR